MNTYMAFFRKEWMEYVRTGRLLFFIILFVLFGIMNPAIAKLTPVMMDMMSESLEGSGLVVTEVQVDAITSWTQFYKNIPIALIVLVIFGCSSFGEEFQKGTLLLVVTKGIAKWKIAAVKGMVLLLVWSVCYWMCFGITFGYNAYYWDNTVAEGLFFSAICYWLFGIFMIGIIIFMAGFFRQGNKLLLGTGFAAAVIYILGLFGKIKTYLPMKLLESSIIMNGKLGQEDFWTSIWITVLLFLLCTAAGIFLFHQSDKIE